MTISTKADIDSGYLIPEGDYQTVSLNLADLGIGSLSPTDGAINLYWSAIFPEDAHKERNAYIPALQYAENPVFCWNPSSGEVITIEIGSSCSDLEGLERNFTKVIFITRFGIICWVSSLNPTYIIVSFFKLVLHDFSAYINIQNL